MKSFTRVTGTLAPMLAPNIDTDVIMPKQFLKGIDRQGLDRGLFFDLRFSANGAPNPDFILNQKPWQQAKFLLVGANFGCGSSREHAVWGLQQIGIRALIGSSFAGIFNDNCQRNGVLTINLTEDELAYLSHVAKSTTDSEITIDLVKQQIVTANEQIVFEVDEIKKYALVNGLDAIGFTLKYQEQIKAFEQQYYQHNPWLDVNKPA
ncbi:3-isopropylmalate dehydratase small subunit [Entomomonas moraniae]|uniref:3-isopropylmalate dehydratase small subunit n=1 Tax=Entomomonas moraniae TaxID=2213226 RepID=A0A3Q9JLM1_9GAMM|nr:3-isopropylmalate dehydratase small subunit [Entomomonas moraniae]AZS49725.1 3-isopropylmalate dehydratase small subunit [Entomomonas moraniae]